MVDMIPALAVDWFFGESGGTTTAFTESSIDLISGLLEWHDGGW